MASPTSFASMVFYVLADCGAGSGTRTGRGGYVSWAFLRSWSCRSTGDLSTATAIPKTEIQLAAERSRSVSRASSFARVSFQEVYRYFERNASPEHITQ